ncbi:MAG: SURF1 family protein [Longimicrobiales bacterium]
MAKQSRTAVDPLSITVSGVLGTLLVLFVAVVCVRLGFWQLDRLEQRRARNAAMASRLEEPVIPLASSADTAGLMFRRVHVRGELDHTRSIVYPGRSHRGSPGVHLLTPLLLGDGSAVLVNRGWVASADGASIDLAVLSLDALEGDGIVLPLPGADRKTASAAGPASGAFQRVWFLVDPVALQRQFPYRLASVEVRLLPDSSVTPPPLRVPPPALDEGPHMGYALQWFSFAAIALIGWVTMVLRRGGATNRRRVAPKT